MGISEKVSEDAGGLVEKLHELKQNFVVTQTFLGGFCNLNSSMRTPP